MAADAMAMFIQPEYSGNRLTIDCAPDAAGGEFVMGCLA
jgi:hypothetical protein